MIELHDTLKSDFNLMKEKVELYEQPIKRCENYLDSQKEKMKFAIKDIEILKKEIEQHKIEIFDL